MLLTLRKTLCRALLLSVPLSFLLGSPALRAEYSSILEVSAEGCEDSAPKAQKLAYALMKRQAAEMAQTHVQSTTSVKDFVLESDIIESYSEATVSVLEVLSESFVDGCHKVRARVEVKPTEKLSQLGADKMLNDPTAPLTVKLWTNQSTYKVGDQMLVYVKGNKPFYGMLAYRQVDGSLLQLLPNPNRTETHFNGGVVYVVPGDGDEFSFDIEPPFGVEQLTLFASTAPLGDVASVNLGPLAQLTESTSGVKQKTRGIKMSTQSAEELAKKRAQIAEFSEIELQVEVVENP